jgi:putative transposase
MTKPRTALISLDDTPYYHCVSRCVRRAYLCGFDKFTGRSFEHRRGWIVERIKRLAAVFAIDVAAYAVMSDHFHVVLRVDAIRASNWSTTQVFEHWSQLFDGPSLMQRHLANELLSPGESELLEELCKVYRDRLGSISWFMRCLNERIARAANIEDGCTGRFWEGRFHSQALLDATAVLSCMTYVDLNPIRASMADTPEASDYTSVQERIRDALQQARPDTSPAHPGKSTSRQHAGLLPFSDGSTSEPHAPAIPFTLADYLALVDWTGRSKHRGKRGFIPTEAPPILERIGLDPQRWLDSTMNYGSRYHAAVGSMSALQAYCRRIGTRWIRGQRFCRMLYPGPKGIANAWGCV